MPKSGTPQAFLGMFSLLKIVQHVPGMSKKLQTILLFQPELGLHQQIEL